MADLGRQVKYGVGKETTPGTAVAATFWMPQLKFDLNPVVNYVTNESAFGVMERQNASDIDHQYAKGSMTMKLTDKSAGLILLGAFGSVSSASNADASGTVKDHTFTINQSVLGQTLTFVRKDSLSTLAFALGRIDTWKLNMKLGEYIQYDADVMAKIGASTTATPAYVAENEFLAKNIGVRTASTVAGLSGATDISAVESFTLTVNPNLQSDYQAGSSDPYSFSSQGYDFKFEMECRYNDQTFENAYKAGTALALQIDAKNTAVTIGTSANPELKIQAPKVLITDWARMQDLNKPMTQKMTGTIHYSVSDTYALKAVLTNLQSSY